MTTSEPEIELELRRTLPVRPDAVFEAWTRPEIMREWLAPGPMTARVQADVREGGTYRIEMQPPDGAAHVATGRYLEIVPGRRLVFTWGWEGPQRDVTTVTVELHARGDETELVLRHGRFRSAEDREQHVHGWIGCVEKLERLLAARSGDRDSRPLERREGR